MNLLFFGSSSRQLFGAYHAPPPSVPGRGAAVLCPPFGAEYLASHRILRRLALRLSENGYHVLRFDYYGTGDSAGRRDEGDLESWCADASLAVDELRDMSGYPTVAAFGIRLGAVIGWRLVLTRDDVQTAVLWDPVVKGTHYVRELVGTQLEYERSFLTPRPTNPTGAGKVNILGFPLTEAMRRSVEAIEPEEYAQPTSAHVTLVCSEMPSRVEELQVALKTAGARVHTEMMFGEPPWRESRTIFNGGNPFAMIERMVELLK